MSAVATVAGLPRRALRRLPVLVFFAVMATLPLQAWLALRHDPIEVADPARGLRDVTWAGTVNSSGRLSVSITYRFDDDIEHTIDIRVPAGARYLAVNGVALAADIGQYATTAAAGEATVSYELPGAVTRYRDGAILQLAGVSSGSIDGDEGLFPCPQCYLEEVEYGDVAIFGELFTPGADAAELHFLKLSDIRAETEPGSVRFAGIDRGGTDVGLIAILPEAAVPDLPRRDGTVGEAWDQLRTELESASSAGDFHGPGAGAEGNRVAAIVLLALLGLPLLWIAIRWVWDRGSHAAAKSSDETWSISSVRPNELEPALAGVVVGINEHDGGDADPHDGGRRSVVAATVLDLARRRVIELSGTDARRFAIRVPAGAAGATPFEKAVLLMLRPLTDPSGEAELTGPPLWSGKRARLVERHLQVELLREARRNNLLRARLPVRVTVPLAVAMSVIAIATADNAALGWTLVFVGPVLAVIASLTSGLGLTARGRHERDQWRDYATWLRDSNPDLRRAGPHEVHTLGEKFVYAAALGGAPYAAASLSPSGGGSV